MTIRHLKIFITVVQCGKMGQAAKQLFISQPSVSQAIKELEAYYAVRLFERLSKKLYITHSGEILFNYATHIIQSFDEMEQQINYCGQKPSLRIGATVTVGSYMLNPLILAFEKKNPDTIVKIVVNNTHKIKQMLLTNQLDVALVEGDIQHADLIRECIYQDLLVVGVGKSHSFYGREKLCVQELEGVEMISRETGSGVRQLFEKVLASQGVSVVNKWECTTTEAIKTAVMAGQGVGVFSKQLITNEVKSKKLHIIPLEDVNMTRDVCAVWHKNKFMSDQISSFLATVKSQR